MLCEGDLRKMDCEAAQIFSLNRLHFLRERIVCIHTKHIETHIAAERFVEQIQKQINIKILSAFVFIRVDRAL